MNVLPRHVISHLGLSLCALAIAGTAQAQGWDAYVGGSLGGSDYGTAFKGFIGKQLTPAGAVEAQIMSFGSETYQNFGNSYKRSAWSLGVSGVGQLVVTPTLRPFGKIGLHMLKSEATGPGLSDKKNSVKLGIGAGLAWQMTTDVTLRGEFENIGGSAGDVYSLGLQFRF